MSALNNKATDNLTPMPANPMTEHKSDGYNDDIEKSGLEIEPHAVEASSVPELDPIREAKLTRKLDLYLIPVFCVSVSMANCLLRDCQTD